MIAFQFVSSNHLDESNQAAFKLEQVDQYLRYYFIDSNKTGAITKNEVIPAVLCTEKYKSDTVSYDDKLLEQFERSGEHMT